MIYDINDLTQFTLVAVMCLLFALGFIAGNRR